MFQNQLIAVPLRFGFFAGLLTVAMFVVLYLMALNPFVETRIVDVVLIPIFLFFAMKDFRDLRNGQVLHYWQGMTVGVITYLTMATLSALFILLFLYVIDPTALQGYIDNRIELITTSKSQFVEQLGMETYEKAISDVQATTPFTLALDDFLKKSIIGLMLTIMISIILRRQPK